MKILKAILIIVGIGQILLGCLLYWQIYAYCNENLMNEILFHKDPWYIIESILIVVGIMCLVAVKRIKINQNSN